MAGEIVKTQGIVLTVNPWSQTSHMATWLTRDHGCVTTCVKGAVRPKSAFLGQYDLFYTCELLYYASDRHSAHAIRETTPLRIREHLRADWRAATLAGYAAALVRNLVPAGGESAAWFRFFENFLDSPTPAAAAPEQASAALRARIVQLETGVLKLAGLSPDFTGMRADEPWTPFSLDSGRCGPGLRAVRLAPATVRAIQHPYRAAAQSLDDALRFLGLFLSYHLEQSSAPRRLLLQLL